MYLVASHNSTTHSGLRATAPYILSQKHLQCSRKMLFCPGAVRRLYFAELSTLDIRNCVVTRKNSSMFRGYVKQQNILVLEIHISKFLRTFFPAGYARRVKSLPECQRTIMWVFGVDERVKSEATHITEVEKLRKHKSLAEGFTGRWVCNTACGLLFAIGIYLHICWSYTWERLGTAASDWMVSS